MNDENFEETFDEEIVEPAVEVIDEPEPIEALKSAPALSVPEAIEGTDSLKEFFTQEINYAVTTCNDCLKRVKEALEKIQSFDIEGQRSQYGDILTLYNLADVNALTRRILIETEGHLLNLRHAQLRMDREIRTQQKTQE